MNKSERINGMFLAGACGDALGAPVEFMGYSSILERYGPGGIRDLDVAFGKHGAITDDTQMLLWTAEGLIRADNALRAGKESTRAQVVRRAYLRWFSTQRGTISPEIEPVDGWLIGIEELHASRSPGTTCMGGLGTSIREQRMGTMEQPVNPGNGCGAIMRMAPAGAIGLDAADSFRLGCELGVLSHGEPGAYLAGGFMASMISDILHESSLDEAIANARRTLKEYPGSERIQGLVDRALALADSKPGDVEALMSLGGAWAGDEALALSLYAALSFPDDLEAAMVFAVNHSGDSDSTGAIVGNLLGCVHGPDAIPTRWSGEVELREVVETIATDSIAHFAADSDPNDTDRYPAW